MPREPGPIQHEAGPVPSHNGLRLEENQCLPPPGPETPQYHPEESVRNGKSRMRMPPLQDSKLLAESEFFQQEIAARTKESDNRNRQKPHKHNMTPMLHGLKPRRMYLHLLVLKADRYFGERQHVSVQTTERYLGCTQRFRNAVNDQIGLENRTSRNLHRFHPASRS